jgi:2-keto-4-pentenoate hydratase/2-oxohepta-3-ene-1,7-dioic acid hydratase in catechol pathway
MKLVIYRQGDETLPGVLTERGVVGVAGAVGPHGSAQQSMCAIIDRFDDLRPELENLAEQGPALPLGTVSLCSPLPRPGKVLCCAGNYWEHADREPKPLQMFLKSSDAVIGPGGTVVLPRMTEPWMFMHEAELAVVVKGPAKEVDRADWRSAVFGYTCLIDVSARGRGRDTWKRGGWLGKSFDTFCPIGPCIVTADEVPDPNALSVRLWNNGELRHDYTTDDMEHDVSEIVEFASAIMTLNSGDVLACGTNHEGLGAIQDGERLEIEIERIGRMTIGVRDPLKRIWPRGVYAGADSTAKRAGASHAG